MYGSNIPETRARYRKGVVLYRPGGLTRFAEQPSHYFLNVLRERLLSFYYIMQHWRLFWKKEEHLPPRVDRLPCGSCDPPLPGLMHSH